MFWQTQLVTFIWVIPIEHPIHSRMFKEEEWEESKERREVGGKEIEKKKEREKKRKKGKKERKNGFNDPIHHLLLMK
jgi:hypothetical protein